MALLERGEQHPRMDHRSLINLAPACWEPLLISLAILGHANIRGYQVTGRDCTPYTTDSSRNSISSGGTARRILGKRRTSAG